MEHKPTELIETPQEALKLLKSGNQRFVEARLSTKTDYAPDRKILTQGQKPFAVVVCCSDSRVAPEIFFDQRLGDIFVVRNAGNVVDPTTLGSIEYAVDHLKSPLVVVCGHSSCGAVSAAVGGGTFSENLKSIIDRIQPAVKQGGEPDVVARQNALIMAEQVRADAPIAAHVKQVVAAYYDISTGIVEWL